MDNQLPVFVYGTLRPGFGNYSWALAGKTVAETDATLPNSVMHHGGGFPLVVHGDATVTGVAIDVDPDRYGDVLAALDALEGYRPAGRSNLYDRVVRTVYTPSGPRRAWVYLYAADGLDTRPVIASGDWATVATPARHLARHMAADREVA